MASSDRQNSEDSDAGYAEARCGDGENDGCGGQIDWWERQAARPISSYDSPSKPTRGYHLAGLSDQMICSGSVAMSCRCDRIPA